MALFESYERREKKILGVLKEYGIKSIEECKEITLKKGIDVDKIVRGTQPICFENAVWAYTVGAAIAIKQGCKKAADAATMIGVGLQSFCIPGSVAENRKVGLMIFLTSVIFGASEVTLILSEELMLAVSEGLNDHRK